MPRALISVSDKRGVVDFARRLVEMGWELISTGGTAKALTDGGLSVRPVEDVTGFPEIMDGRVKTLHPGIHAGILARRDLEAHLTQLAEHGIEPIDLVAVNLYPFREAVAKPGVKIDEAIEQIDIGGPALLRSAAKNHASVLPVVDPRDYDRVTKALREDEVDISLRRELAAKVFSHTSAYDAAIAEFVHPGSKELPPAFGLSLERMSILRYGENPEQRAALYASDEPRGVRDLVQLHGRELSFNNLLDVDAAAFSLSPWPDRPACVLIKHTTPCGIAVGSTAEECYTHALSTDPVSAFGSVVGLNTVVDAATAEKMADQFIEVVVAPRFHDDALAILTRKKNIRLLELPLPDGRPTLDFKRVRGGLLVQDQFQYTPIETNWKVVTGRQPSAAEWADLRFAWAAIVGIKSNAILIARDERAIGLGAGQMSRVDAVHMAVYKAGQAGHDLEGSVLASDAFFPFPDGVEMAAEAGIKAIVQPGGSKRDGEVTAAADDHGIAMVMTGRRQFRH